jgi:poly(A) polymerase
LRLTRHEQARLDAIARNAAPDPMLRDQERQAILYHIGAECWRDSVRLAWARSRARLADEYWRDLLRLPDYWKPPVFPLTGKDLLAGGVKPGPQVGRLLSELEDWWVAAGFKPSKDELIARLHHMAGAGEGG